METIKTRFDHVNQRISDACLRVNRKPDDVKLVVVVKRQPFVRIIEVIKAGAIRLGENYPEVINERKNLTSSYPNLEWHLIGHIQSRKIKYLKEFTLIHSVDSIELAYKINPIISQRVPILLEINVSGEISKQGFNLADDTKIPPFCQSVSNLIKHTQLNIVGIMSLPPFVNNAEENRLYFRRCKKVLNILQEKTGCANLSELSMGTSQDYHVAIEEGATIVRVGEEIMGKRQY